VEPAGIARRAAGMDARRVARDIGCPVRNTPLAERTPTAKQAGRAGRGVLSFGYFSLHKQRKVTRSVGVKALDFGFAFKSF